MLYYEDKTRNERELYRNPKFGMGREHIRVGEDFVTSEAEGADGKLEDLVRLGRKPGLEVGDLGGVDGEDAVPRVAAGGGDGVAGLAAGDGDEVGAVDVGPELL